MQGCVQLISSGRGGQNNCKLFLYLTNKKFLAFSNVFENFGKGAICLVAGLGQQDRCNSGFVWKALSRRAYKQLLHVRSTDLQPCAVETAALRLKVTLIDFSRSFFQNSSKACRSSASKAIKCPSLNVSASTVRSLFASVQFTRRPQHFCFPNNLMVILLTL